MQKSTWRGTKHHEPAAQTLQTIGAPRCPRTPRQDNGRGNQQAPPALPSGDTKSHPRKRKKLHLVGNTHATTTMIMSAPRLRNY